MGEVYRARDTRLGREVALKILSDGAPLESERLERFEQEARLAGSLNHPNLVVVHDVGAKDGAPFLVTELLEGESLRHRLSRGRLPLRSALELATQIADGLAAAHARGIVHRDIKPENIFVTPGGRAKLLDFGIAKLTSPRPVEGTRRNLLDTTLTPGGIGTNPGAVLGTPGYMSPEQVRGDPVDARTDIFSLGAVLYELLTGARAFPGATFAESGHAILESDPAPLPESTPAWVGLVVQRCLEKEPARRFQSAADLAFALGATVATSGSARAMASRRGPARWTRPGLLAAALMLGLIAGVAAVMRWGPGRTPVELPTFERITFRAGPIGGARFTPEGRIVFSAPFDGEPEEVYSHARGRPELQRFGLSPARLAAVSPKTGELAVLLGSESIGINWVRGTLARVPATGGVPRELAEHVAWADWTGSGDLAVARRDAAKMWIERPLGKTVWSGPGWISDLRCSPDGEHLAFIHHPTNDRSQIVVLDRSNAAHVILTSPPEPPVLWSLAWMSNGKGVRFTAYDSSGTTVGSVSLAGSVRHLYRFPGAALLQDVAPDGTMLFTVFDWRSHLAVLTPGRPGQRELAWFNLPDLKDLSPDGRTLLFSDGEVGASEMQVVMRQTDGAAPKVLGPGFAIALAPDRRTAAMVSTDGHRLLLVPTAAGTTSEVALSDLVVGAGQWSHDGRRLWVTARPSDRPELRLYAVDVTSRRVLEPIPGSEVLPDTPIAISPDDRWIAVSGPDQVPTVYSVQGEPPIRITSIPPDVKPTPAGWSKNNELWLVQLRAVPPRLVKVALPGQEILRSIDIDLREPVAHELTDARISKDESVVAVQYLSWQGRLEAMHGIPPDR
jgi:Tol biopolymer transport system component